MTAIVLAPRVRFSRPQIFRFIKRSVKRIVPLALAIYFIPICIAVYVGLGLLDFARNKSRTLSSLDRYFAGNGIFTWLLSPFNLLMDVLALPFRNKGIYKITDLPKVLQTEKARRQLRGELAMLLARKALRVAETNLATAQSNGRKVDSALTSTTEARMAVRDALRALPDR